MTRDIRDAIALLTRDDVVPYNVGMNMETLRQELDRRRGLFSRIAVLAGVNRRTIQRMADEPDYNPTLETFDRVWLACMKTVPATTPA